jgi:predicted RND superfamily exporter protein
MTDFIIKYRWFIIGICLIIGVIFAFLIPMAETDPEIRNYIPATMDSRLKTDRIEKCAGSGNNSFLRQLYP